MKLDTLDPLNQIVLPDGRVENVLWRGQPDANSPEHRAKLGPFGSIFLLACSLLLLFHAVSAWYTLLQSGIDWSLEGKISEFHIFRLIISPFGALFTFLLLFTNRFTHWVSNNTQYLVTETGALILSLKKYRIRGEHTFLGANRPTLNGKFIKFLSTSHSRMSRSEMQFGPLQEPAIAFEAAVIAWKRSNSGSQGNL